MLRYTLSCRDKQSYWEVEKLTSLLLKYAFYFYLGSTSTPLWDAGDMQGYLWDMPSGVSNHALQLKFKEGQTSGHARDMRVSIGT